MKLDNYPDVEDYRDMFCIQEDEFIESIENLEDILIAVDEIFSSQPVENKIKVHFPDNLTMKYRHQDWDGELNFRVVMKDIFHAIIDEHDLDIDTISAQSTKQLRFFNNEYEVLVDVPEFFDDPLGNVLGVK